MLDGVYILLTAQLSLQFAELIIQLFLEFFLLPELLLLLLLKPFLLVPKLLLLVPELLLILFELFLGGRVVQVILQLFLKFFLIRQQGRIRESRLKFQHPAAGLFHRTFLTFLLERT